MRRRDPFPVDTCPKCGRTVAVMHGQHDYLNVFTLRRWHRTPDRKERCHNTHWRLGDGHA